MSNPEEPPDFNPFEKPEKEEDKEEQPTIEPGSPPPDTDLEEPSDAEEEDQPEESYLNDEEQPQQEDSYEKKIWDELSAQDQQPVLARLVKFGSGPTEYHLQILIGPPGVGKTFTIISQIKNLLTIPGTRIIIFAIGHTLLSEIEKEFRDVGVTHLKGIGVGPRGYGKLQWHGDRYVGPCDAIRVDKSPNIENMLLVGVPQDLVCKICGKAKTCKYYAQFKTKDRVVVAPLNYLKTKVVEKLKPTHVYIDDATMAQTEKEKFKDVCDWFAHLQLMGLAPDNAQISDYYEPHYNYNLKKRLEDYVKDSPNISDIDPRVLKYGAGTLLRWGQIFDKVGDQKEWAESYLPEAIQLAISGIKVMLSDAMPDTSDVVSKVVQKHNLLPPDSQMNIEVFSVPTLHRLASEYPPVVWRIFTKNGPAVYTHKSLQQGLERYKERIVWLLPADWKQKIIGIISYEDIVGKLENSGWVVAKSSKVKFAHFNDIRGINRLMDVNILIILGTYQEPAEDIQRRYLYTFHENRLMNFKFVPGVGYDLGDEELNWLVKLINDYEVYQALHRCRILVREDEVVVYLFSVAPKWLEGEVTVVPIEITKRGARPYQSPVEWLKEYLRAHGTYSLRDIALDYMPYSGLRNESYAKTSLTKIIRAHPDTFIDESHYTGNASRPPRWVSLK
ncbi:MAG: hypothetical protein NTY03_01275 [Candidatus Bathyarchaeota archaeon]|nr:hypothetical protein [Candidatus Bathyarchaeota archaeon]